MEFLLVDAHYKGSLKFNNKVEEKVKNKKVALFSSVNFLNLEEIKQQLTNIGCEVLTTKAKRTDKEAQILGCDSYHDSFESDIIKEAEVILYIGDGMFHPKALLLAQIYNKIMKEVIIWDPINQEMRIIDKKNIETQKNKMKSNLIKYLTADTIGVIVTTKWGQQYLNQALKLKKESDKKVFVFVDDNIDMLQMNNYPFIQVWVNTACPRIGLDDITTIDKPLINIKEAFNPEKALEKF